MARVCLDPSLMPGVERAAALHDWNLKLVAMSDEELREAAARHPAGRPVLAALDEADALDGSAVAKKEAPRA
jgi:hypothetical protein